MKRMYTSFVRWNGYRFHASLQLVLLLTALLAFSGGALPALGQSYAGRMGVEASGNAFVDIVRQSYRWDKPNGTGDWTGLTSTDVDASGWPKTDARWIFDGRPVAEWTGSIDDPQGHRVNYGGVYKGSFSGQAVLNHIEGPFTFSNQTYNASTNVTTFDLTMSPPGPHHGLIVMSFTQTKRTASSATGSGIAEFRLIRPGYAANTTQVFTNEYINTLTSAAFSTIRFMVVGGTNNNVEWGPNGTLSQTWSQRTLPTDAAQLEGGIAPLFKKGGWAWEYIIQLCNQTNMDMWINIPVSVDDNYILELATLIKNTLNPNLKIYLEHTNELWNFGFLQYSWNKARAKEEIAAGGSNLNYDGNNDDEIVNQRRHAKRVRDIVQIFGNVLGTNQINTRIRGVLAGVTPDPNGFFIAGRLSQMLEYLSANYGAPSSYIYSISIPLYYGGPAATGQSGTENFTVQQIVDYMRTDSDNNVQYRRDAITLANQYNLVGGVASYEGGPDIGGGSTTNIANRIMAVRDIAQKEVYKRNFATNFFDIGGNIAMQFALASNYNRYGSWGLTDDINNPDRNYLFQAVRELVGTRSPLRNPENPANTAAGLDYKYYEGGWNALPDFNALTAVKQGNVTGFDLSPRNRDDSFGFRYTGFVNVPTDGNYTFYTASDDGSKLYIGNTQVVNNDGAHPTIEASGSIGLKAGKHAITVTFFEATGGEVLEVRYEGPGISKQLVPTSALFSAGCTANGSILMEKWNNIPGITVSELTNNSAYPASPSTSSQLSSFEIPVNAGNDYGTRVRGYICAPATGSYTFYLSGDDYCELWLSTTDNAANKAKIASVIGWTNSREWTKYASQTSAAVTLTAGQRYYVEALHKEANGGDNLAVGWTGPGIATITVIPGSNLSPVTGSGAREGAQELSENVLLYPNPASDQLTVEVAGAQALNVVLVDALGKNRLAKQAAGNRLTLNTASLENGLFLVRVQSDGKTTTKKVMIAR